MKIAVLGGGVIGVSTAYYLAKAGHEVVVIDRQRAAGLETSFANAGLVAPGLGGCRCPCRTAWPEFRGRSGAYYPGGGSAGRWQRDPRASTSFLCRPPTTGAGDFGT